MPTADRNWNTGSNNNPIKDGRQYITLRAAVKQFLAYLPNFLYAIGKPRWGILPRERLVSWR
jgi:hypothetical protein